MIARDRREDGLGPRTILRRRSLPVRRRLCARRSFVPHHRPAAALCVSPRPRLGRAGALALARPASLSPLADLVGGALCRGRLSARALRPRRLGTFVREPSVLPGSVAGDRPPCVPCLRLQSRTAETVSYTH